MAGFFDGDGSLDVDARMYTLHWVLSFTDNWAPQLEQIKTFLEGQGIRVGGVRPTGTGGFKVEVAEISSLLKCARMMLAIPCLFKKRGELEMMLAYFEGHATGKEISRFLNAEVRNGVRVGKLRTLDVPYSYPEAKEAVKKTLYGNASIVALDELEREAVRKSYLEDGETIYQIARAHHVSSSTVFRTVRGLQRGSKKLG